ncbi:ABC transporter permease [Caldinitratiruptor microaerophilus]|uniref:ABC transport system permease protein n=1 Tax=Caldinitratiruptor microaerophilus TaxID=671077 RepID=A0AA35CJN2_9FIRM|nr:ABC transporter permease [Caldinitratiruptor microaerophilus]BDG59588.1 hypothetical protein caldi_06780 [Caldinitratiruptor microaerophilus]
MRVTRWLQRTGVRIWFSAQMAGHGVLANPLRSGLTVLGVAIGVASVVSLMAIGEGARRAVVEQFRSLGENVIVVRAEDPSAEFDPDEAGDLVERVGVLTHATPVIEAQATMRWRRTRGVVGVLGVNEQFPIIRDHPLAAGHFFTSLHVKQRAAVAVLGYNLGSGLMGGRSPVGQAFTLGGRTFRVIGVLAPKGAGQAEGIDDKVVIPYTAAQPIAGKVTASQIWAKARSAREADLAVVQLGRIFRRQLGMDPGAPTPAGTDTAAGPAAAPGPGPGPGGPFFTSPGVGVFPRGAFGFRAPPTGSAGPPRPGAPGAEGGEAGPLLGGRALITVTNLNRMVQQADKANRIMTLLLGGIAAVSLLVGGLGIMNIMLVAVTERTAEIGLRRALGATQGDLVVQFLLEALYLSGMGALAGIAAGVWGSQLFARYGLETAVNLQAIRTAVIVALGSGLLFGVYPAVSASSLPPVEALRR